MRIQGNISQLMKKHVVVFTKNDEALDYIKGLKRNNVKEPDKYSVVTWD